MTETTQSLTTEQARARRRRRAAKAEVRDAYFEALAEGWTHERIAKAHGVSVATVRREVNRAIAARQVEPVERHVRLQIARVMKALALLDTRVGKGETAAVGPFLKTVAALDRYHGLPAPSAPVETVRRATPSLPRPPLALTHAAPPLPSPTPESEIAGDAES